MSDHLPNDVMISYSHRNKENVFKVRDKIKDADLNVWIDEESMPGGNLLTSMSAAVDSSSIVLIFPSRDYEESKYCMDEANYAHKNKQQGRVLFVSTEEYTPNARKNVDIFEKWILFLIL